MRMTIDIRPLLELTTQDLEVGEHGYTSSARYVAHKTEDAQRTVITLDLVPLERPYEKTWDKSDAEEFQRYQDYARQGYSLGAYDGSRLVGIALTEARWWHRTLWLWEFHVAPVYRRMGIGRRLMEALVSIARQARFRVITLETQSTNVPAIAFYRALGFAIDSLDLSFYTNHDVPDGEVAIFMKYKLE